MKSGNIRWYWLRTKQTDNRTKQKTQQETRAPGTLMYDTVNIAGFGEKEE